MTRAVLINEKRNDIYEIDIDISPSKNEIFKLLKGKASFLGQWPEEQVVIVKTEPDESFTKLNLNLNRLPRPFTNMEVLGRILLIRMDDNADPQNFTLKEYHKMAKYTHPRTRSSSMLISRPLSRNISCSSEYGL
mgnify:FL=1|jgi:hypothetical protein|tara:strand:- start:9003 stop:9407 length:405 start_codon:yes stop_codon:yes gene_type:complete